MNTVELTRTTSRAVTLVRVSIGKNDFRTQHELWLTHATQDTIQGRIIEWVVLKNTGFWSKAPLCYGRTASHSTGVEGVPDPWLGLGFGALSHVGLVI